MSDPFLGEIKLFAGNFAPRGYALCQGQLLSIAQNSALFSILGTTYGGNGVNTFALPDLRGRVPVQPGQGPGLSSYTLGEMAGVESTTLTSNNMPIHTHSLGAVAGPGNTNSPVSAFLAAGSPEANPYAVGSASTTLSTQAIGTAGGSQPFSLLQPYLCLNFIIALEGIFPSRN